MPVSFTNIQREWVSPKQLSLLEDGVRFVALLNSKATSATVDLEIPNHTVFHKGFGYMTFVDSMGWTFRSEFLPTLAESLEQALLRAQNWSGE